MKLLALGVVGLLTLAIVFLFLTRTAETVPDSLAIEETLGPPPAAAPPYTDTVLRPPAREPANADSARPRPARPPAYAEPPSMAGAVDRDHDLVPDEADICPGTPPMATVIARGCSEEQYDAYVAALPEGTYAFNAADTMVVERNHVIVLVLKPRTLAELASGEAEMRGVVRAELLQAGVPDVDSVRVEVRQRKFSGRMRAVLQGPESWQVRPRAGFDETRMISARDSTVWVWDVKPRGCARGPFAPTLACGEETLTLAVYAFFGEHLIPWPLLQERIHVRATLGQKVADIAAAGFPWVGAALLPALGAAWWSRRRRRVTILFLAANPHDTSRLNLDEEIRAIDAALQKSPHRNRFRIEQHWAVRSTELDDFLLRHRPQIVHFSGHGSPASELILEGGTEMRDVRRAAAPARVTEAVSPASLSRVFAPMKGTVRCVVLNACYSKTQALAIAEHVDCVVGMSRAIADSAAINFSAAFYQALAFGENVDHAFQLACSEIDRASLADDDVPQLIGQDNTDLRFTRRRA